MATIFDEVSAEAKRSIYDENEQLRIIPIAERKLRFDSKSLGRLKKINNRLKNIDEELDKIGIRGHRERGGKVNVRTVQGKRADDEYRQKMQRAMKLSAEATTFLREAGEIMKGVNNTVSIFVNYFRSLTQNVDEVRRIHVKIVSDVSGIMMPRKNRRRK